MCLFIILAFIFIAVFIAMFGALAAGLFAWLILILGVGFLALVAFWTGKCVYYACSSKHSLRISVRAFFREMPRPKKIHHAKHVPWNRLKGWQKFDRVGLYTIAACVIILILMPFFTLL